MDALIKKPLKFAHRGGSGPYSANTIDAFALSLDVAGTGLETDSWRDAAGEIVLTHDSRLAHGWRRGVVAPRVAQRDLATHRKYRSELASLADLVDLIAKRRAELPNQPAINVSIDVKEETVDAALALATQWDTLLSSRGVDRSGAKLWVCLSGLSTCVSTSAEIASSAFTSDIALVHSTRLSKLADGPERHAAALAAANIDACNLYCSDWTTGLTTLYHRFGVYCFSWGCDVERTIVASLIHGCDAIYSDDVALMSACYVEVFR